MNAARGIYQDTLDRTTAALLSGDSAGFARHISYPYRIRTVDGRATCRDYAEFQVSFDSFVQQLDAFNLTEYTRTCDAAQFVAADQISGYHTTRAYSGSVEVLSPFLTSLSMHRQDETLWQISLSATALRGADWSLIPQWLDSHDSQETPQKTASEDDQRLHLLQTILDRISVAFLSGDLQGWLNSTSLPYHMITRQGAKTFATVEDVSADFDLYRQEFEIHGVTDIIREAKTATLIDGDQIVGTYRTHILRGANHIVPPWDASMTLRLENGLWRVTTVMRAIGHLNWSAANPADIEDIPQDTPKKGDHQ